MLEVSGLSADYGSFRALFEVSLAVDAGETVAVIGPNGAGKTTLMRVISGMLPPHSGALSFEGRPIAGLTAHRIVELGIAHVPENRRLFPRLTVEENLRMGLATLPRGARVPERIYEMFPVLRQMLGRRGGDLSGGQQQQLAIARALVARPRLLVLDEPTEGIQPSIIKEIGRVIEQLVARGDMAILLVEQYFEFARDLAAAYVVMQRGEIVLSGRQSEMDEAAVRVYLTV